MPSTTSYVYFDVNVWEAKLFTAAYRGNLMAGVLSDEDVRVKAPLMPLHLSQSGTVGNN